jgi:hypothetical protein
MLIGGTLRADYVLLNPRVEVLTPDAQPRAELRSLQFTALDRSTYYGNVEASDLSNVSRRQESFDLDSVQAAVGCWNIDSGE